MLLYLRTVKFINFRYDVGLLYIVIDVLEAVNLQVETVSGVGIQTEPHSILPSHTDGEERQFLF